MEVNLSFNFRISGIILILFLAENYTVIYNISGNSEKKASNAVTIAYDSKICLILACKLYDYDFRSTVSEGTRNNYYQCHP